MGMYFGKDGTLCPFLKSSCMETACKLWRSECVFEGLYEMMEQIIEDIECTEVDVDESSKEKLAVASAALASAPIEVGHMMTGYERHQEAV